MSKIRCSEQNIHSNLVPSIWRSKIWYDQVNFLLFSWFLQNPWRNFLSSSVFQLSPILCSWFAMFTAHEVTRFIWKYMRFILIYLGWIFYNFGWLVWLRSWEKITIVFTFVTFRKLWIWPWIRTRLKYKDGPNAW